MTTNRVTSTLNGLEQCRADVRAFLRNRGIRVPGKPGGPLPSVTRLTDLLYDRADEQGWSDKTLRRNEATLRTLLGKIEGVRSEAAAFMSADHSLETMNRWLTSLGEEAQPTKTQARAVLATIHVCIYDLMANKFDRRFASVKMLSIFCYSNDAVFPLGEAKAHPDRIKVFLRDISRYRPRDFRRHRYAAGA